MRKNKQGKLYTQTEERIKAIWIASLTLCMEANNWNTSHAAKAAGVQRSNFLRLLRKFDIKRPQPDVQ